MKRALAIGHALAAWLLVAAIAVQVLLVGLALRNLGGSGDFSLHVEFGYTVVGILALAVVLTAVAGGVPRRDLALALGLLILYFVQTALPALRTTLPAAAALHPPTALVLFGLAAWLAIRATRRLARTEPARQMVGSLEEGQ
jgi:hypothetical protein